VYNDECSGVGTDVVLVPKLQFGNPCFASSCLHCPKKQELQEPGSQAGAWEPAEPLRIEVRQRVGKRLYGWYAKRSLVFLAG
jgi:hypothetical protein